MSPSSVRQPRGYDLEKVDRTGEVGRTSSLLRILKGNAVASKFGSGGSTVGMIHSLPGTETNCFCV